jgi:hypothetical protein
MRTRAHARDANFLACCVFRPGASADRAGVLRTEHRVQANSTILTCAMEQRQTRIRHRCVRPRICTDSRGYLQPGYSARMLLKLIQFLIREDPRKSVADALAFNTTSRKNKRSSPRPPAPQTLESTAAEFSAHSARPRIPQQLRPGSSQSLSSNTPPARR